MKPEIFKDVDFDKFGRKNVSEKDIEIEKDKIVNNFEENGMLYVEQLKKNNFNDKSSLNNTVRLNTTKEDRVRNALSKLASDNSKGYSVSKVSKFLSDENVKAYEDILYEKTINNILMNNYTAISEEELKMEMVEYLKLTQLCKQIPTPTGLAAYTGITVKTLAGYKNNPDSKYHTIVCNFYELCHDTTLMAAMDGTVSTNLMALLGKSWFDMDNSTKLELSIPLNSRVCESDSIKVIEEQLLLEDKK